MGDDQLDVLQPDVRFLQRLKGRLSQDLRGEAEHFSPVHPDLRAARALGASRCGTRDGIEGHMESGVEVLETIRSVSWGRSPAAASASFAASAARSVAVSLTAAIRRSTMPVRSRIHVSDVSTSFSRSAFVRMPDGT